MQSLPSWPEHGVWVTCALMSHYPWHTCCNGRGSYSGDVCSQLNSDSGDHLWPHILCHIGGQQHSFFLRINLIVCDGYYPILSYIQPIRLTRSTVPQSKDRQFSNTKIFISKCTRIIY